MRYASVFVIDDDPIFSKIITQAMVNYNNENSSKGIAINFELFDNTESFFDSVSSRKPALVVLDYRLEHAEDFGTDGLEILKEIKDFNPRFKIVSYTGDNSKDLKKALMDNGANYFLNKEPKSIKAFSEILNSEVENLLV